MEFQTGLEDKPWWVPAILGLVLGGVIFFLGSKYLLEPKREQVVDLDARLASLQSRIQEGRAAKAQLPRFREEVRRLELKLDKLLRILPARRNTPELLRRIRALTEQGDFDLKRFAPGRFVDRDFYSEWPITIQLDGSYHNLAQFLDRVGSFSRIINIEGLNVTALGRGAGNRTIAANFIAKTFVYKEPEQTEEEAQQGG